ncbi:MAG: ORF6N domain-containing protein [Treponema sp.]|nr:ORF6N domain-containing protein [Treponema sp.]
MESEISILEENSIRSKIHFIRGQQVMLDCDLAQIYGYETKRFNEQIKNNRERFDEDFMFRLNNEEVQQLSRSKISTLNKGRGSNIKYAPYAFTEQGIYMLMTVLKGDLAVTQSKMLIRTFKEMKHFIQNNSHIFTELDNIKKHLLESDFHHKENDKKIQELFSLMDKYNVKETQGIFFQGQIFDAYAKFESFLTAAKKEIILIDNYVDLSILERLSKKKKTVNVTIYTAPNTKLTAQDVQAFNSQYPTLTLKHTTKTHDRFLIIDNSTIYHIGASLKDLGKKCFCFDVLDSGYIPMILKNL